MDVKSTQKISTKVVLYYPFSESLISRGHQIAQMKGWARRTGASQDCKGMAETVKEMASMRHKSQITMLPWNQEIELGHPVCSLGL